MKLLALICLLFAGSAAAQITTYTYQGQPYDTFGDSIQGFIELPNPLEPSSTTTITPTVQSFLPNSDHILSLPTSFTLTTDPSGNIIAWTFTGNMDWACECTEQFSSSDTAFDNVSLIKYPLGTSSMGTSTKPGIWTTIAGPPMMAMQSQLTQAQKDLAQSRASTGGLVADNQASEHLAYTIDVALAAADALIAKCRANQGRC